jgi:CrcB protein
MDWFLVAMGGALGSVARYGLSVLLRPWGTNWPWGTFSANAIGSFLIGVAYVWLERKWPEGRLFLITGFLGGFTTFSAFSLENLIWMREGRLGWVAAYSVSSLLLGIGCAAAGFFLARLAGR